MRLRMFATNYFKIYVLEQKIADGKITFKKPTKRPSHIAAEAPEEKKSKDCDSTKEKPQSRLLSFGDDEDE